jgi:hypothetical protein
MAFHEDAEEAPLDPAAERLRGKLVRLLFVSGGIMLAGLIAVFAAIVYKIGERESAASRSERGGGAATVEARIVIPAGHRLTSTALDGDRALVQLEAEDGGTTLLLIDLATGAVTGRYAVETE